MHASAHPLLCLFPLAKDQFTSALRKHLDIARSTSKAQPSIPQRSPRAPSLCASTTPCIIWIRGPTGIGKSHFVRQCILSAYPAGCLVNVSTFSSSLGTRTTLDGNAAKAGDLHHGTRTAVPLEKKRKIAATPTEDVFSSSTNMFNERTQYLKSADYMSLATTSSTASSSSLMSRGSFGSHGTVLNRKRAYSTTSTAVITKSSAVATTTVDPSIAMHLGTTSRNIRGAHSVFYLVDDKKEQPHLAAHGTYRRQHQHLTHIIDSYILHYSSHSLNYPGPLIVILREAYHDHTETKSSASWITTEYGPSSDRALQGHFASVAITLAWSDRELMQQCNVLQSIHHQLWCAPFAHRVGSLDPAACAKGIGATLKPSVSEPMQNSWHFVLNAVQSQRHLLKYVDLTSLYALFRWNMSRICAFLRETTTSASTITTAVDRTKRITYTSSSLPRVHCLKNEWMAAYMTIVISWFASTIQAHHRKTQLFDPIPVLLRHFGTIMASWIAAGATGTTPLPSSSAVHKLVLMPIPSELLSRWAATDSNVADSLAPLISWLVPQLQIWCDRVVVHHVSFSSASHAHRQNSTTTLALKGNARSRVLSFLSGAESLQDWQYLLLTNVTFSIRVTPLLYHGVVAQQMSRRFADAAPDMSQWLSDSTLAPYAAHLPSSSRRRVELQPIRQRTAAYGWKHLQRLSSESEACDRVLLVQEMSRIAFQRGVQTPSSSAATGASVLSTPFSSALSDDWFMDAGDAQLMSFQYRTTATTPVPLTHGLWGIAPERYSCFTVKSSAWTKLHQWERVLTDVNRDPHGMAVGNDGGVYDDDHGRGHRDMMTAMMDGISLPSLLRTRGWSDCLIKHAYPDENVDDCDTSVSSSTRYLETCALDESDFETLLTA